MQRRSIAVSKSWPAPPAMMRELSGLGRLIIAVELPLPEGKSTHHRQASSECGARGATATHVRMRRVYYRGRTLCHTLPAAVVCRPQRHGSRGLFLALYSTEKPRPGLWLEVKERQARAVPNWTGVPRGDGHGGPRWKMPPSNRGSALSPFSSLLYTRTVKSHAPLPLRHTGGPGQLLGTEITRHLPKQEATWHALCCDLPDL